MSRIGSLALLFAALPVSAQPIASVERMPPLDRTRDGFYGAIVGNGPRVLVTWRLSSPSIERGKTIDLFLVVEHAANPNELKAPPLAEQREWKDLFESVENLPPKVERAVEFGYRLKPRNVGSFELPLPLYRFYLPQAPEGKRFQTALIQPVALTVTEPIVEAKAAVPLDAPPEFFRVYHRSHRPVTDSLWIETPLVFIAGGIAWILHWRWRYPDAAKQARWRRTRCVDKAMKQLAKADHAGTVAEVFGTYLHERGLVPADARTAREMADALVAEPEWAEAARSILEAGDRGRFGTGVASTTANDALGWIAEYESRENP